MPADTAPTDLAPGGPAVAFARLLRRRGLDVPVHAVTGFTEALAEVGVADRSPVYWAGRATLVRRPEDFAIFDEAFATFWDRRPPLAAQTGPSVPVVLALDDGDDENRDDHQDDEEFDPESLTLTVRFSPTEVLREKDFGACTAGELAELHRLMHRLRLGGATRRSRRLRPTRRPDGRPDLRRTVRAALRSGGEPIQRRYRLPTDRPRRVVLLVDVSGSMEPYARALIRFAHAAVIGRRRVEAFTLGTRLTRVTRQLTWRDPDAAVASAAREVADWSGGTRLGDGLREFNDRWGVRGMARGAVVVILSDGWDRGDPETMGEQMARLGRVAHRIVWVNPLKASPGYAPLARGMAAALPHVDEFVEGHSLAALEELAAVLSPREVRATERQRRSGQGRPAWPGNAKSTEVLAR